MSSAATKKEELERIEIRAAQRKELERLWTKIPVMRKAEADIRLKRILLEEDARKLFREIMLYCQVEDCEKTCESMLCLDVRAMTT